MKRNRRITPRAALYMLAAALCASGCGVALAPGYTVLKETRAIQFVPGSPSELRINLHYDLKNTGTAPLPFVDVTFPAAQEFGRKDVRVQWDAHPADLQELPEEYRPEHPDTFRIEFASPWPRGRSYTLDVEYTLSSPQDSGSRITIGNDTFHLAPRGWAALPQPPKHFLSPYPARPPHMTYSVRVPSGFRALARGRLRHRRAVGTDKEYVFQLGKNDLAPFVVAGRYIETPMGGASGTVVFWTLHPLNENAGSMPQRISNAWATLEKDFGPMDTPLDVPHVVEVPGLLSHVSGGSGPAVASFPGGALVNEGTLALGIASDAFVEQVSHALAHNWFGDQMYPSPDAVLGIGEGLPEYATIVIDEAQGGLAARRKRISYFLKRYDEARARARETPLGVTLMTDPPGPRAIALAKAPLMYVALEDECGEGPVRHALRQVVALLRGQEVGFDDLRSALEQTCGKDLGEFFRRWLYGKGLPPGFARRYEAASARPQTAAP